MKELCPIFIDPVLVKTSPKRSFSMTEKERFGIVFVKTRSINSGTGLSRKPHSQSDYTYRSPLVITNWEQLSPLQYIVSGYLYVLYSYSTLYTVELIMFYTCGMDQISKKTPNPKCWLFLKNWPVKVLGGRCLSIWDPSSPFVGSESVNYKWNTSKDYI